MKKGRFLYKKIPVTQTVDMKIKVQDTELRNMDERETRNPNFGRKEGAGTR